MEIKIDQEAITAAIKTAVGQIDKGPLANVLAAELQKATTNAIVEILHEGVVDIVCKLCGIGDYRTEDVRKRAAIKAELFEKTKEKRDE